jgi:hypothetical protein
MDGCTWWFDGWWRECCDRHDSAYLTDSVTLFTHVDLGICVLETAPSMIAFVLAIMIATLMVVGTAAWWTLRYRLLSVLEKPPIRDDLE